MEGCIIAKFCVIDWIQNRVLEFFEMCCLSIMQGVYSILSNSGRIIKFLLKSTMNVFAIVFCF